jgi:hypothetical protein
VAKRRQPGRVSKTQRPQLVEQARIANEHLFGELLDFLNSQDEQDQLVADFRALEAQGTRRHQDGWAVRLA